MPTCSEAITRHVLVTVESRFVDDRSRPDEMLWFFAYHVRIENGGSVPVQVLARHWIITDADGQVQEVRGPGVVGEQPLIAPGQSYEYTSACPLRTPFGTMHGTFRVVTESGEFDAEIAPFLLAIADAVN